MCERKNSLVAHCCRRQPELLIDKKRKETSALEMPWKARSDALIGSDLSKQKSESAVCLAERRIGQNNWMIQHICVSLRDSTPGWPTKVCTRFWTTKVYTHSSFAHDQQIHAHTTVLLRRHRNLIYFRHPYLQCATKASKAEFSCSFCDISWDE